MGVYWELATAQQLRDIYAKVNATEDSIKNDVQYLMSWMEKRPHLPNVKDQLYDYLCKHRDDFLSDELLKADLTKKPKENEINSNLEDLQSGIEGSFRKLCVD